MKVNKKVLTISICALFIVPLCLSACGKKAELTGIEAIGLYRTRYLEGESFDSTGMTVIAHYTDGSSAEVKDYQLSPSGAMTSESKAIAVSYEGFEISQKISVGTDPDIDTHEKLNALHEQIRGEFSGETFSFEGKELKYRLRYPDNQEGKAPLVLFLHGSGERGSDNSSQLKNSICYAFNNYTSMFYDSVVIAPQCPTSDKWIDTDAAENGIYDSDKLAQSQPLSLAYELVKEYAKEDFVDENRIYIVGLSMGGGGTWDLLTRHGETFAAAVPICGFGDPSKAEALADIPIYTFHGSADPIVSVNGTREMVRAITAQGKGLLHYVEFEGAGHDIWNDAIVYGGDATNPSLLDWLFQQKKS